MPSVIDVWRGTDPTARLVSGSVELLGRPVRGMARTRAAPPHLPGAADGHVLLADAAILDGSSVDSLVRAVRLADLDPAALWVVGDGPLQLDAADDRLPVLAGAGRPAAHLAAAAAYLEAEGDRLASDAAAFRLAGAEAALADPRPSAPAGVIGARLRRGVAVSVDGALDSLNPREAGRALATRFAAAHARLLADRHSTGGARRTRDGLWLIDRPIRPGASVWLFDDLPFARVDEVGLESLAITLRALLRRRPAEPAGARREPRTPPSTGDALRDTLLAVARANGRIAPAARSLGVHRNTVLYRLRRAAVDLGIDPRRPDDALRLLRAAEEPPRS